MDGFGSRAIGKRVRAYRKAAGLTAEQLASRVGGMTGNSIAKLENGHRKDVSTELLVELSWALQVPPLVLLLPIENERATITVGGTSGTMEALGPWIQGLPVADPDADGAASIANAVHGQYRQLVMVSVANDLASQVADKGLLTAAEAAALLERENITTEALEVARTMMGILRDRLALDGDG